MTPDLETTIREAARTGRLHGLTLWKLTDGRFQANHNADGTGWRVEIDADPAEALKRALTAPSTPTVESGSIFD